MIYNLQVLRALAAFIVVFPHLGTVLAPTGLTDDSMVFGQFGVDLFFVISGFMMMYTCVVKPVGPGLFAINRIIRVAPLYWLLTFLTFAVALAAPQVLGSTQADLGELFKSLAFIPYLKDNGLIRPMLHVGWTLNYEMYFYLVFALALWFTRGNLNRTLIASSTILIMQVALPLLVVPQTVAGRFYTDAIMLEFCFGMCLAWLSVHGKIRLRPLIAIGIMGLAWLTLLTHRYLLDTGDYRVIFAGIPAFAIVACALSLEESGYAIRQRHLQLLGAASYSLYLSHPFVAQSIGILARPFTSPLMAVVLSFVTVVLSLIVAVLLYRIVEKPMTRVLRNAFGERLPLSERVIPKAS